MVDPDRSAPPTSRAVAMFVIVFAAFVLIGLAAWFVVGPTAVDQGCTADAMSGPDGRAYGRDPQQDCRFVDDDGNVLPGQ